MGMDCLYPYRDLHCNSRFQWSQYHGRNRRSRSRNQCHNTAYPCSFRLSFREYHLCRLSEYYVPSEYGRNNHFAVAMVGAVIGFFWYNTYPAQVFMGDTGSLMLGGVIAVLAIILRKELLIPVLCGIFLIENLSVMLQVIVFKYRKKKYGLEYAQNNRLFKMSPLHHHYQKDGFHESKIVNRMIIIGVILAIVCLITLKMR